MDQAVAYSTLAMTVTLAVARPRVFGLRLRVTPGAAAVAGVFLLLLFGLLSSRDLAEAALVQWRPLVALTSIMVTTGVAQEVGAFERLARVLEGYARRTSPERAFGAVFLVAAIVPSLLNNDAAILLLTPVVVGLARRLAPSRPDLTEAFAFAVFLAPGVAPFVVSNPMNMIVAEFAGIPFNAYSRVMAPVAVAGAFVTWLVLRRAFRSRFEGVVFAPTTVVVPPAHPAERPLVVLLVAVFLAYPVMASFGGPIWLVSVLGAAMAFALGVRHRVAPARRLLGHVSPDILVFLWGVFLVVVGMRHVGVVDRLRVIYDAFPRGSWSRLVAVGGLASLGSAVVDNHPMALLDMMALGRGTDDGALLAALVGGDIGPRLLPIGSLAGLLWMDRLRRNGVTIGIGTFVRVGTLALVPTWVVSILILGFLR